MYTEKLEYDAIRYNPELEGFEAAVRVFDAGHIFRYPTFISAPLNANASLIARNLVQKAITKHKSKGHVLRSATLADVQRSANAA